VTGLAGDAVRTSGHRIRNSANAVAISAARGLGTADELVTVIGELGQRAAGTLTTNLPSSISIGRYQDVLNLASIYDEASELLQVQKLNPAHWDELIEEDIAALAAEEFGRQRARLLRSSPDGHIAPHLLEQARAASLLYAQDPKRVAQRFGQHFDDAHLALHASELNPNMLDDRFIVRLADAIPGIDSVPDSIVNKLAAWEGIKGTIFTTWLTLRPAWSVINTIDSTLRAVSLGMRPWDDLGTLFLGNWKAISASDVPLRTQLFETFLNTVKSGDEAISRTVIERASQGKRTNIVSLILDAGRNHWRATAQNKPVIKKLGAISTMAWKALDGGFADYNTLMEASLRVRVTSGHYIKTFDALNSAASAKLLKGLADDGLSEAGLEQVKQAIAQSGSQASWFEALLNTLAGQGGASKVRFSALMPSDFRMMMARNGVRNDLYYSTMLSMLDDLETTMRRAARTGGADDVIAAMDEFFADVVTKFEEAADAVRQSPIHAKRVKQLTTL
jgi:hypothetical protein